ncbi:MAG: STAS domain-containing protein [Acidobacteria bacterium]|nr:STAS domain-containing protein [Acidobacteriota bacterium]
MKIVVEDVPPCTVVRIAGRLVAGAEATELREEMRVLEEDGRDRFVVDLEALDYIDSGGLGELVAARQRAREHGGTLVLAAPRGKVRDILALTALDRHFAVFDDVPQALASFAHP